MQSVIHMLHISTLATWLSVASLGAVIASVPKWERVLPEKAAIEETQLENPTFEIGEAGAASGGADSSETAAADVSELSPIETLPAPPEIQPLTELAPLPDVPEMPVVTTKTAVFPTRPAITASASTQQRSGSGKVASKNTGGTAGQVGNGKASGSGMSETSRLAAGRMPAPVYPAECRRKGQTGTVLVEFTVDANGRVISAHAKSATPWPLLNNEAVRTVKRWKFPPGGIMNVQRPIVFQLR